MAVGAEAAIAAAVFCAAESSSAAGSTRETSPLASASSAVSTRPASRMSFAMELPTVSGSSREEPASGTRPRAVNGARKSAVSAA